MMFDRLPACGRLRVGAIATAITTLILISVVMPIMSIYCLSHGQYCYSGHVVNLYQDVLYFSTSLIVRLYKFNYCKCLHL